MTSPCTTCNGLCELTTQGSYYDFEPPTVKCPDCDGTGDGYVQDWKLSIWRDTVARNYAMREKIVTGLK